ncbi:DNA-directed RNA polymerase subunit RPC12/RpoP [Paraburkholderia sp. WSM4179]|nr:DNA-directed RNA polymerase subunit RPC12/RpoP [Paraburkholderia sp. WSM4179]
MEILTEMRYTYACVACGHRATVWRADASHAGELAICARCDGQVWLSSDDSTDLGKAAATVEGRSSKDLRGGHEPSPAASVTGGPGHV